MKYPYWQQADSRWRNYMNLLKWISTLLNKKEKEPFLEYIPKESKDNFKRKYDDLGSFTYSESGFSFAKDGDTIVVGWNEITKVIAYKTDFFSLDEINLTVHYRDERLTISEKTAGWYQFIFKMQDALLEIPKSWDIDIVTGAYKANERILLDK